MKKIVWLVPAIVTIILASCSNPQAIVLASQEETLRSELQAKAEKSNWSNEIEPERLSSPLNNNIEVDSKEYITVQMLNSLRDLQPEVFPDIKDFASLDCSAMNANLYNTIDDFCKELCKGTENLQTFFYSEYFFNYVFFKKDFEPFVEQFKKDDILFERYLICKAFESQDLVQVPLRFYNNKEYIDLSVYLTYHNGYKITQIEVIRWGKTYGESEKEESDK